MVYSVWNQPMRRYDYYQSSKPEMEANVEKPSHLRNRALGSTVEQSAWPLPLNARRVGFGDVAKGRVASTNGGGALGGFEPDLGLAGAAMLFFSAYLLWKYVVPAK
jgi:hypothetical protein